MSVNKAELQKCIEDFRTESQSIFKEGQSTPVTSGEMHDTCRSIYYVFDEILKSLD